MNENNELSDIVLNKNSSSSSSKKMILAIATLGIILIAVVTLMKSCGTENPNSTPQAIIPPQPQQEIDTAMDDATQPANTNEEPLFEEVEVVQEDSVNDADLDKIAKQLKEESQVKPAVEPEPVAVQKQQKVQTTTVQPKKPKVQETQTKKVTSSISYYVQVGSFTKYEPNKKFLASITKLGYNYTYRKVNVNGKTINKVLVGPFTTESQARDARRVLRSKVEPGAFLVK